MFTYMRNPTNTATNAPKVPNVTRSNILPDTWTSLRPSVSAGVVRTGVRSTPPDSARGGQFDDLRILHRTRGFGRAFGGLHLDEKRIEQLFRDFLVDVVRLCFLRSRQRRRRQRFLRNVHQIFEQRVDALGRARLCQRDAAIPTLCRIGGIGRATNRAGHARLIGHVESVPSDERGYPITYRHGFPRSELHSFTSGSDRLIPESFRARVRDFGPKDVA